MIAAALTGADFWRAAVTCLLIGGFAPLIGTWVVLRRLTYLADAMSHATLGGVAIAIVAGGSGAMLGGALAAGVTMALLLAVLVTNRRLHSDAVIGVVGTALFALGVLILAGRDDAEELEHALFGDLAAVRWSDVALTAAIVAVGVVVIALLFDELRMTAFDPAHASQVGVRVQAVQTVLLVLVALTVVACLRTVGSLMAVSLLVTPAATARLVTRDVRSMAATSCAVGLAASGAGLVIAQLTSAPPGAAIALTAAGIFAVVFVVSLPKRMRHHARA